MTKKIASITSLVTAALSWPLAAGNVGPTQAAVTVSVYDFSHEPPKTLAQAEELAAAIFTAAGVDTRWTIGSVADRADTLNDFSMSAGKGCVEPLYSTEIQAQILPHAPSGFSALALGYSLPCAQRGFRVTVYADRVEAVSGATAATFRRVLGCALAHEAGHVLLRSTAHGASGLMKAVWTRADWQRAAATFVPFTTDETGRILQELRRAEAHVSDPAVTSLASAPVF